MNKLNISAMFLAGAIGTGIGTALTIPLENKEPLLHSSYDKEQQVICYYTKTSLQCLPAVESDYD
ncbi:hypothetical protein [Vibrio phage vB_VibM_83AMN]|nr:hypothetical protein [Vibrio phage vB_VibM_83AMN]